MKQVLVEIEGVAPLMLNNAIKADPMHPITKAIKEYTKKRTKTEEDLAVIQQLEWLGALYPEKDGNFTINGSHVEIEGFGFPIIKGDMIEGALIAGAKKHKLGQAFKAGVFCDDNPRVRFEGEAEIPVLFGNRKFVDTRSAKLQGKTTIMVTRAFFPEWKIQFSLSYLPDLINTSDIKRALEAAGQQSALGTYRPKYGRFRLTAFEEV